LLPQFRARRVRPARTECHRSLAFGKLGEFAAAAAIKKGALLQVEGELRSREYDKGGVKHKAFECRLESILKLDRAAHREGREGGNDPDV
jgi:single-strand DNA-binding protein